MTFLDLAEKVLREENKPLSAADIWELAVSRSYDQRLDSAGPTPRNTLQSALYLDWKKGDRSRFTREGTSPILWNVKSAQPVLGQPVVTPEVPPAAREPLEQALHPFLSYFAETQLEIRTKTIGHQKSIKRGAVNQWLHPDMVGCYFTHEKWQSLAVRELRSALNLNHVMFFSFEIKRELTKGNFRDAFFEAVSNSSWAHEAYLVAASLDQHDEDFWTDLQRRCSSFGLGVIKLDTTNPDGAEILIPARRREQTDWETIDRLAAVNPDFAEFLVRVRRDVISGETREETYDAVGDADAILKEFQDANKTPPNQ